jgi:PhnB protein
MAKAKNYRPEGVGTITPYLTMKNAAQAIDFYKKAFGAQELMRMGGPDGKIGHATLRIADSTLYLCDEMMGAKSPTTLGGSPVTLHMYVPDCDATWKQAIAAGAKEIMPLEDQFWGDRYGQVQDPFGHLWGISTQKEDLTPEEMNARGKAAMANMPKG